MILEFVDYNKQLQTIRLEKLTEITGSNIQMQNYIMNTLCKYFGKERYTDDQLELFEFSIPKIRIDNEEALRSRYSTYSINSVAELNAQLSMQKNTAMYEYMQYCVQNIEISKLTQTIDVALLEMCDKIYEELSEDIRNNVVVEAKTVIFEDLYKYFITATVYGGKYIEYMDTATKLELYLNIIKEIYLRKPEKMLVCIQNVQQFIGVNQVGWLGNIIDSMKEYDITFVVQNDNAKYILSDIRNIRNINVVNDINLNISDIEILKNTINENYPIYKDIDEWEVWEIYREIAHLLCYSDYTYKLTKNDVYIKIINECYDIHCNTDINNKNISNMEINYIMDMG